MDRTAEEALDDAFRLLEKGVRDETIAFETSVYDTPFLPQEPKESARVFHDHCKRLNEYFGNPRLRHYCWMRLPKGEEKYIFLLKFEKGLVAYERDSDHGSFERLAAERLIPLVEGHHWGMKSFGTPQLVTGPKCVTAYVLLEGGAFESLLKQKADRAQVMNYCQGLPDGWPDDAIVCEAFLLRSRDSKKLAEALGPLTSGRVRFEAYHVIAGFSDESFATLTRTPIVQRALKLSAMQFQREWGNVDQRVRTQLKLKDAELESKKADLRAASDLISTFDQVLHSGLNALRSTSAGLACQDFADGTPPSVLSYRLVKRTHVPGAVAEGMFDELAEQRLLATLSRVWVGEEATAGALSFGRLLAHGKILAGMTTRVPIDVLTLVKRAAALLNCYDQGAQPRKLYRLDDSRVRKGAGVIPAGYLAPTALSVLVYELFLNAYNHAELPIHINVDVRGGHDHVCLFVRSGIKAGKEWVQRGRIALPAEKANNPQARRSFLMRFAEIEAVLNSGLTIASRISGDGLWYESELCMRALETENGEFVHPHWEQSS